MAEFKEKNNLLYIDGKKVLKGWESYSGWYWFATEKVEERKIPNGSIINRKEVNDIIWKEAVCSTLIKECFQKKKQMKL